MKLLMNDHPRGEPAPHPTDPVEIRRLNYQTPAMLSHPPIPVSELANHIERLKASDNSLFSQEYEVRRTSTKSLRKRLIVQWLIKMIDIK